MNKIRLSSPQLIKTKIIALVLATLTLAMAPAKAEIVINEVDADQTGTDSAEFIELYDGGVGFSDLSGLSIVLYNGSDDASYLAFDLDGFSTNADGYFVLCGNSANTANCDLDVSPETNLIQNGADAVALVTGDAANYPNDTPVSTTNLLDALVYDTNDRDDTGLLVLLNPGQPQVNEDGTGNKDTNSSQRCANGSGGLRNSDTYEQHIPTPGFSNTCGVTDILINEVDADQTGSDSAEFIELYDGGVGFSDLTGLSVVLYNGSDDASYLAFDLDGLNTNANGYFVLCANAATTPNCDLDVSPETNLIQNGADAVALVTGDAANYPNDTPVSTTNLLDALVYDTNDRDDTGLLVLLNPGQPQVNEDGTGNKDTNSSQRCANGSGGLRNSDTYEQHSPTPGSENVCGTTPPTNNFGVCNDIATFIHDVQGAGTVGPLNGNTGVIIEAVVTANYQSSGSLGGFYVQEEDTEADADATTSEGLFVSDITNAVNVGDVVRVQGTANESFGLTEINNVSQLAVCGNGAVSASTITLPVISLDELESVEGMLVSLSQPLTVNENFNLARFGEITLSDSRTYQFTHNSLPNVAGYASHLASLSLNQLILDDANTSQNPEPVIYPAPGLSASNTLRSGYTTSLTGIMSYGFSKYRIQPTEVVNFSADNSRTPMPEDVGGDFKIASINVLNYFTTIDTGGALCGPSSIGCRGADSALEFTRQRDKIINAINTIDADILGLVELENNATASLADLVSGLNAVAGAGTYAYLNTGTIGTDAIKVGFIYKPASTSPSGAFAILDSSVDPLFLDTKNRPALAQTFSLPSGENLTLAVNHFKSKGSNCDSIGDVNINDGQGNCAGTRANAATALVNWLATDPTGSSDPDFLILGDLNAYAMEDAITNITNNGYTNLVDAFIGSTAYSFVFSAEAGYLDHALASASLTDKVSDVTEWHINADEPRALDYNTEFQTPTQQSNFYAPDVYRMSDHDPIIIGFNFAPIVVEPDTDGDGVPDNFDNCTLKPNPAQEDTNGDGFGNICDPDLNNDSIVNFTDFNMMRAVFFTNDPDADLNSDGVVNFIDLGIMRSLFFQPPGPSLLVP
ncbi:ExeM/NucH family extracellular endonuclease [Colwellia sp. Arc7-D]|uniref:ExeM/NucH family extracellular endonuclease n=1 Tax=Colwellia sp. Arc7-D TaxID=2161872 RepID=UPI0013A59F5B|nr:ExeM/NucH family extracellular endonuclease [Colwellia sp. Arc7-D]